jgi:hypothetical protein
MKFSLIALALTSTSVMAAAQPVAAEKRALQALSSFPSNLTLAPLLAPLPGAIKKDVPMGRKLPQNDSGNSGPWYKSGDHINIICSTTKDTDPIFTVGDDDPD